MSPLSKCWIRLTICSASTGYIAGVTNPIFENLPMWDVLCNIVTNTITVHKDISTPAPPPNLFPVPPTLQNTSSKTGVVRTDGSVNDEEFGRSTPAPGATSKVDYIARQDSYDVLFMEDVRISSISRWSTNRLRSKHVSRIM